ncbi:extensin family protein [Qipengyuania sp. GH1]|uniref:extensin-like domain-containing protein n=1 Tax=Qipengyuania aestuarii TaxID=2867241 RepID=UPI001C88C64A|nr:extensin family protein [Qipengyuania aestuarii]MBX7535678.1 extensin family protein [Qipengyuania aestuarii]
MRRITLIASIASLSLAGCGTAPEPREAASPAPAAGRGSANWERPQAQLCLAQLGSSGAQFAPLPDRRDGGGCAALDSVKLDGVGGDLGPLTVTNLGPLACPLANSFAAWARYGVDRAARQILGSPIVQIETMGSYSCRNVAGTTRRSAHSRAEAIDIGAFVLADGRRITVKSGWDAGRDEREFLRTVHRSACKRFGTVLGPDYNSAHKDHFHLEHGDGSFCR